MNGLNPTQIQALRGAFQEYSDSCIRAEAERELQKEIIEKLASDPSMGTVDKPTLKKLAKMFYQRNGEEQKQIFDDLFDLYTAIRG